MRGLTRVEAEILEDSMVQFSDDEIEWCIMYPGDDDNYTDAEQRVVERLRARGLVVNDPRYEALLVITVRGRLALQCYYAATIQFVNPG